MLRLKVHPTVSVDMNTGDTDQPPTVTWIARDETMKHVAENWQMKSTKWVSGLLI